MTNAFAVLDDGGVELKWKSSDTLIITYPGTRVLFKRDRVGVVNLRYRPIGLM